MPCEFHLGEIIFIKTFIVLVLMSSSYAWAQSSTQDGGLLVCKPLQEAFNEGGCREGSGRTHYRGKAGPKGLSGEKGSKGEQGESPFPANFNVERFILLEKTVEELQNTLSCLTNMMKYNYKVSPTKLSWQAGRDYCLSIGRDLALHGIKDFSNRVRIAKQTGQPNSNFWVGFNDKEVDGQWIGVDGSVLPSSEIHWDRGQPNNSGGNEDCGDIRRSMGWKSNDFSCDRLQYALCELPMHTCNL